MKKIKIAFYKHSKTFFGSLIRWKQSHKYKDEYSQYTHVELVFSDLVSFSSSEEDKGIRFKKIEFKKANWDFIELEISEKKYNKILDWCEEQVNYINREKINNPDYNSYDWLAIVFSQTFGINRQGANKWFCSEIVCTALQQACMLCEHSANFINPADLCYLLKLKSVKKV